MENIHTIYSLKELNAILLTEVAKLRKENDKIHELEKKLAEVEAGNAKLKQIIEENAMHDIQYPKSFEKKMDSFFDSEDKKMVSNLMRERNREKKLQTQVPLVKSPTSSEEETSTLG
ncbi:hypothetical protein F8M41_025699 [Gigaspora margarita]|uniref:Uncharacterized protein n=1 Tax=Gigaspora margarita TaxID=4874 RepID=A0A8H4AZX4_GIGMA|nr:hypothetical protein F8M41_025699 [Gigaspora margarita]